MSGSLFALQGSDPALVPGLANLTLVLAGGADSSAQIEAAGAADGGFIENFALAGLVLGDEDVAYAELRDMNNNGRRAGGAEAFWTHMLSINDGSRLDLRGLRLYVQGDVSGRLDGWILDGRLFDSTLPAGMRLNAVFDAGHGWTAVSTVPEPGMVVLLAGWLFFGWAKRGAGQADPAGPGLARNHLRAPVGP